MDVPNGLTLVRHLTLDAKTLQLTSPLIHIHQYSVYRGMMEVHGTFKELNGKPYLCICTEDPITHNKCKYRIPMEVQMSREYSIMVFIFLRCVKCKDM